MSKDSSDVHSGGWDIIHTVTESIKRKNFEGFEGMNYEQIRQPYNPKHAGRNSFFDERKDANRPDGN